jgi:FkbM family methyltransferase
VTIRGSERLLRLIAPATIEPPWVGTCESWDGTVVNIDSRSYLEWLVLLRGGYESDLQRLMHEVIGPDDVVVDVGANVGLHSCSVGRRVGQAGAVVAVEPVEELARRLESNSSLNGLTNVTIVQVAASDAPGVARISVPSADVSNRGIASLHVMGDHGVEREVPLEPLDQVLDDVVPGRPVRLVKIDVEGHEFAVMRGLRRRLVDDRPVIVFEFTPASYTAANVRWNDVANFLTSLDYELFDTRDRTRAVGQRRPARQTMILACASEADKKWAHVRGSRPSGRSRRRAHRVMRRIRIHDRNPVSRSYRVRGAISR